MPGLQIPPTSSVHVRLRLLTESIDERALAYPRFYRPAISQWSCVGLAVVVLIGVVAEHLSSLLAMPAFGSHLSPQSRLLSKIPPFSRKAGFRPVIPRNLIHFVPRALFFSQKRIVRYVL